MLGRTVLGEDVSRRTQSSLIFSFFNTKLVKLVKQTKSWSLCGVYIRIEPSTSSKFENPNLLVHSVTRISDGVGGLD